MDVYKKLTNEEEDENGKSRIKRDTSDNEIYLSPEDQNAIDQSDIIMTFLNKSEKKVLIKFYEVLKGSKYFLKNLQTFKKYFKDFLKSIMIFLNKIYFGFYEVLRGPKLIYLKIFGPLNTS